MRAAFTPHILNGALLLLLFGGGLWLYPTLPEQIPHHFDLYGQADAYGDATLVRWLLLPILAGFSAVCLYGPAWLLGTSEPNAEKQRVVTLLRRALYWMTTAMLTVMLAVQVGVYVVATTAVTILPAAVGATIVAGLLAIAGITGWLVWGLSQRDRALSGRDGGSPDDL